MQRDYKAGEILLIDKPYRWTSFQVVNKIRWLLKKKGGIDTRVGHAGTLDPLATGLLILCTGKYTKKISEIQAQEKEYTGTIQLGATTPCFDLEKEIDARYPTEHITHPLLREAAVRFTGTQEQVPPLFSAVKVEGERAYEKARRGETAEMKPKTIHITAFELTRIAMPLVEFRVVCSKGTYIRALARDFGLALGSGAHLVELRRTRIGNYTVNEACDVLHFEQALAAGYQKMP